MRGCPARTCYICGKPAHRGWLVTPPDVTPSGCTVVHSKCRLRKDAALPAGPVAVMVSSREMAEGRMIADAERRDPGIIGRTLDDLLASGREPSRAALTRALRKAASGEARAIDGGQ